MLPWDVERLFDSQIFGRAQPQGIDVQYRIEHFFPLVYGSEVLRVIH